MILHNTSAARAETPLPVPTIQYLHSKIAPAPADVAVYCSAWLAAQYAAPAEHVLYQAVPIPPRDECSTDGEARIVRTPGRPLIGRLCTPQQHKWPDELVGFSEALARRHPSVEWEFVGCPLALRPRLKAACGGRASFHEPGWNARRHLHRWDALLYHHPTLTESFGRTCAEAMRCGCIPVVDDRGGFREQIAGGNRAGFLCADFTAFDRVVAELYDPATRREIGQAARARADEDFSLARFAERLLALLRSERLTSASPPSESRRRPSRSPGS